MNKDDYIKIAQEKLKDNSKKIIEPIVNKPKKENKEIKDENKKRKDPRDNKK